MRLADVALSTGEEIPKEVREDGDDGLVGRKGREVTSLDLLGVKSFRTKMEFEPVERISVLERL